MARRLAVVLLLAAHGTLGAEPAPPVAPPSESVPAIPPPAELEARGAVIGEVHIAVGDVFDTSIEGEDGWLYRTANKLHINTREQVVRDQLLFKPGEPYRDRIVRETERLLRANDYMYDAKIVPVAYDGERVDLEVRTRDVWTLNPGISFSRKGGENTLGAQLQEDNLLGTGRSLDFQWDDNVDRTSYGVSYLDPHFLLSYTRFGLSYVDADDGSTKLLQLERPFYALDVRRAGGIYLLDSERNDPRYVLGKNVGEFAHREEYYGVYGGLSRGLEGRWARRWTAGITYERDRFELDPLEPPAGPLPEDRTLVYPWLGFDLVEDGFQERVNQDQISRTEDVLVGLRASAKLGYSAEALGADRGAVVMSASVRDGIDLRPGLSLFGSAGVSGRLEDGELRNGLLGAEGRFYWDTTRRSKFYASMSGAVTEQLDAELQLTLGGDNGLRGYPLRYQAGTARGLLTLEQRYYTNWYPFRLFHVGAAAFFDMGRTWGTDVTGARSLGLLKDVGIGLRLGSSRSSFGNVLHIDLAFPLDGTDDIDQVQLLVQTKRSF
jgi:outer membrane protein assembly factor BamA